MKGAAAALAITSPVSALATSESRTGQAARLASRSIVTASPSNATENRPT
jgi:hypothetical protein